MVIALWIGAGLLGAALLAIGAAVLGALLREVFPKPTPFQRAEARRFEEARRSGHYRSPSRDVGCLPVLVVLGLIAFGLFVAWGVGDQASFVGFFTGRHVR